MRISELQNVYEPEFFNQVCVCVRACVRVCVCVCVCVCLLVSVECAHGSCALACSLALVHMCLVQLVSVSAIALALGRHIQSPFADRMGKCLASSFQWCANMPWSAVLLTCARRTCPSRRFLQLWQPPA
jgi:hypothetical protein